MAPSERWLTSRHHRHAKGDRSHRGGAAGLVAFAAQKRQGQFQPLDLTAPAFADRALPAGKQVFFNFIEAALRRQGEAIHLGMPAFPDIADGSVTTPAEPG